MTAFQPFAEPFDRFQSWLSEAEETEINDPNAMALATANKQAQPSLRMVLLKGLDERGFTFYTNYESRKAGELLENPKAALLFHWKTLRRQVRVEGKIVPVDDPEADAYFASRGRKSRLGAWASKQSQVLDKRETLVQRLARIEAQYPGDEVPRPPFWSGFRLVPHAFEFWYDGEARLHHRDVYVIDDQTQPARWATSVLYP